MFFRILNSSLLTLAATATALAVPPPPEPPSDIDAPPRRTGQRDTDPSVTRADRDGADRRGGTTEADTLLRGPLHEAFARPVALDPVRQPVIERRPPEPLNEVPPQYRPEGDNVIWIPGYWSYDEIEDDFIWISGLWRDVPPSRRWVPGYWAEFQNGYVWTPGEWLRSDRGTVDYLPEPPRSQERGPSSPPPDDGYFWVPGCWEYQDRDYVWRPGYWSPHQRNWVWIPAHYHWTPGGYVYCDGYWDYDIDRRGIVYAPYRGRRNGNFTPAVALDVSHLLLHLFVNDRTHGYYFGDYYGRSSYQPWYRYHQTRRGYDPVFSYNTWQNGDAFVARLTAWNRFFSRRSDFRPRRTLQDQRRFTRQDVDPKVAAQATLARVITDTVGGELFGRQVIQVNGRERDALARTAGALLNLADRRFDVEARGRVRGSAGNRERSDSDDRRNRSFNAEPLKLPGIDPVFRQNGRNLQKAIPQIPGLQGPSRNRDGDQRPNRDSDGRRDPRKSESKGKRGLIPETPLDDLRKPRAPEPEKKAEKGQKPGKAPKDRDKSRPEKQKRGKSPLKVKPGSLLP